MARPRLRYYPRVGGRRLAHYVERRRFGYDDYGTLADAASVILSTERGFCAGSQYPGVWLRDLAFAAPALIERGQRDAVRATAETMLDTIDATFHTDFRDDRAIPTPAEGSDTFPALVLLLDELDVLGEHGSALSTLAALHREKFYVAERGIVGGRGSAWWDSATGSREAYNTAMLLDACDRLAAQGIETRYTADYAAISDGLHALWNGSYFNERRESDVLACDANVIPLYLGLVSDGQAESIANSLERLETDRGLGMRERPFSHREIRLPFLLHRDYHYHIWPWNSFAYAIGLAQYGFDTRAEAEVERVERQLARFGNFLEVLHRDGGPYRKRGFASAQDFLVAAALWVEYQQRFGRR